MTNSNKDYPNFQKYVAETLVTKRKELGWSQETLSLACGRTRNCIQMLECEEHIPDLATILVIFEALHLSTQELEHIFAGAMEAISKDRNAQRELDGSSQIVASLWECEKEGDGKMYTAHRELPCEGITEIYDLLYRLGLTANYTGFFYTAYAVWLAEEHPDRLLLVTKWLYPEVSKRYRGNWKSVERGIRYAVDLAWRLAPHVLQEMAGFPLSTKPTPTRFIAILAKYHTSHKAA